MSLIHVLQRSEIRVKKKLIRGRKISSVTTVSDDAKQQLWGLCFSHACCFYIAKLIEAIGINWETGTHTTPQGCIHLLLFFCVKENESKPHPEKLHACLQ